MPATEEVMESGAPVSNKSFPVTAKTSVLLVEVQKLAQWLALVKQFQAIVYMNGLNLDTSPEESPLSGCKISIFYAASNGWLNRVLDWWKNSLFRT
jgi:hypothetical protein